MDGRSDRDAGWPLLSSIPRGIHTDRQEEQAQVSARARDGRQPSALLRGQPGVSRAEPTAPRQATQDPHQVHRPSAGKVG